MLGTSLSEPPVGLRILGIGWNGSLLEDGLLAEGVLNWEDSGKGLLRSSLDLLCGRVTSLWLLSLAWEEDELRLVSLQALDVGLESLDVDVLAAVVDGNTDCTSELLWNTGLLQLVQRETTTGTNTAVVLDGWAADDWAQAVDWARGDFGSFGKASISASELAARL